MAEKYLGRWFSQLPRDRTTVADELMMDRVVTVAHTRSDSHRAIHTLTL